MPVEPRECNILFSGKTPNSPCEVIPITAALAKLSVAGEEFGVRVYKDTLYTPPIGLFGIKRFNPHFFDVPIQRLHQLFNIRKPREIGTNKGIGMNIVFLESPEGLNATHRRGSMRLKTVGQRFIDGHKAQPDTAFLKLPQ
jgi:hypothetical protein